MHFLEFAISFLLLVDSVIDFFDVSSFFVVISSSFVPVVLKEDFVILFTVVHG